MKNRDNIPRDSFHPKNMFLQVIASFKYAFTGLFHVLLTQRNMRFHFSMAVWVMSFAIVFRLTDFQKAYLFIVITFVFSMETLNTCIEALVDITSPDWHEKAKIAKDTAAAAVLVVSIGSVMSAGYLLIPPFFRSFASVAWIQQHMFEIVAVAVIVASVLLFWGSQVFNLPMAPIMIMFSSASSFSICHLCVVGRDALSFVALQFFSTLLFHSLGRRHDNFLVPLSGHMLGIIVFAVFTRLY